MCVGGSRTRHGQLTSAKSPLPNHHRLIPAGQLNIANSPWGQLAMGGQRESQVGKQISEQSTKQGQCPGASYWRESWVSRQTNRCAQSNSDCWGLPIFTLCTCCHCLHPKLKALGHWVATVLGRVVSREAAAARWHLIFAHPYCCPHAELQAIWNSGHLVVVVVMFRPFSGDSRRGRWQGAGDGQACPIFTPPPLPLCYPPAELPPPLLNILNSEWLRAQ